MAKIIFVLIIVLSTSCAGTYQQASTTSRQAYIGMPLSEFLKSSGRKAKVEAMEAGYTVYKMNDYNAWTMVKTDTKFFYFDANGKLYKIDGGEFKQNRYQIEVINK